MRRSSFRRQILTSEVGPHTERIKNSDYWGRDPLFRPMALKNLQESIALLRNIYFVDIRNTQMVHLACLTVKLNIYVAGPNYAHHVR